ncbi:hypothetical protein ACFL9U_05995 [Thermodesulfobacteriota bacterium]
MIEFGQFEDALIEFNKMIKSDSLRLVAAKNIIRCHLELATLENAVTQYQEWLSNGQFPAEQLEQIRSFFQTILIKKRIPIKLPKPKIIKDTPITEPTIELSTDIISVTLPSTVATLYRNLELDVGYHNGPEVIVFIRQVDKALSDIFRVGMRLDDVQFNSRDITYTDPCIVSEKRFINLGPKKGHYAVTLKISSK